MNIDYRLRSPFYQTYSVFYNIVYRENWITYTSIRGRVSSINLLRFLKSIRHGGAFRYYCLRWYWVYRNHLFNNCSRYVYYVLNISIIKRLRSSQIAIQCCYYYYYVTRTWRVSIGFAISTHNMYIYACVNIFT